MTWPSTSPAQARRWRGRSIGMRLVALAVVPTLLAVWFGILAGQSRLDDLHAAIERRDRTEVILALTELRSSVLRAESLELGEVAADELVPAGVVAPPASALDIRGEAVRDLATLRDLPVTRLVGRPDVVDELSARVATLFDQQPGDVVTAALDQGADALLGVVPTLLTPAVAFANEIDLIVDEVRAEASPSAVPDATQLAELAQGELLVFREGVVVLTELIRNLLVGAPAPDAVIEALILAGGLDRVASELVETASPNDRVAIEEAFRGPAEVRWGALRNLVVAGAGVPGGAVPSIDGSPIASVDEVGPSVVAEATVLLQQRIDAVHDVRRAVGERVVDNSMARAERVRRDLVVGAAIAVLVLLAVAVAAGTLISRLLGKLAALRRRAEQIINGDETNESLEVSGHDEIALLGTALDDMTKVLHARAEASERFARSVVAAADEAIITLDDRGVVTSANHAASELFGIPVARLAGAHSSQLAERLPLLADVPVGITNADAIVRRPDGIERSVLVTTRRTGGDDAPFVAVFARDITERKQLENRLAHQATHDDLTGLANRASLVTELDRASARSDRSGHGFGLLFVDLDRFKSVNDTLGHQAGDMVLREVASRLESATRDTDLVARNGGDEFVVLAEDAPDIATLVRLAERIQQALSAPFLIDDDEVPVSASIGVTWLEGGGDRTIDRLRDADVAMYNAKSSGPGQIRVFDDDMRQWVEQRFDLERELRRAVGAGALDAYVQPVIDLRRGQVVGGELLCRWTTDDGREIPPDAFIDVAEDSTLVVEIGRWMLDRAGQLLDEWRRDGIDLGLSVNLSGRHIDHPGVVDDVRQVCERWTIDPAKLVIEITETSLLRDLAEAAVTLGRLHDLGIPVCVDDFGVGYASLRYLRELPVELVKIDRSIVAGFGRVDSDTVIVTMLTRLADVLEIDIVAEGVETEEQREQLTDLGCDFAQGFLFARPMPPDEFRLWLASWRRRHAHPSTWEPPIAAR